MSQRRRRLGAWGEGVVRRHLVDHGYRIIETNFRCARGEIDIIAEKDGCLAFLEVRTKSNLNMGTPEESITPAKRLRLVNLANIYLQAHPELTQEWRIDVVAVELGPSGSIARLEVIESAVGEDGGGG